MPFKKFWLKIIFSLLNRPLEYYYDTNVNDFTIPCKFYLQKNKKIFFCKALIFNTLQKNIFSIYKKKRQKIIN